MQSAAVAHRRKPKDSKGSAAPVRCREQRSFDRPSTPEGIDRDWTPALEISWRRAGDRLCLQYLQTGRWCRSRLGAWMTG